MNIVTEHPGTLYLGKTGECHAHTLAFREPCIWAGELGKGVAQLLVSPPDHGKAYPVILEQQDGMALWHVTERDTAHPGYGHCELRWSVDGRVLKSRTYTTYVASGVAGNCGCGGDSWGEYLERVTRAGAETVAAAERAERAVSHVPTILNGNWWTWDPREGGYTDTGVPATGDGGVNTVISMLGHGLKQKNGTIALDMASDKNPDKTLPISASAVDAAVGNIEILLKTIRGV